MKLLLADPRVDVNIQNKVRLFDLFTVNLNRVHYHHPLYVCINNVFFPQLYHINMHPLYALLCIDNAFFAHVSHKHASSLYALDFSMEAQPS